MRQLIFLPALLLSACMTTPPPDTPTRAQTASDLPPVKMFSAPRPVAPRQANGDIARDFLDLAFRLESGRELAVFTRFETPITVRVTGAPPPGLGNDLARLLARMRHEAGIDIKAVRGGEASITIEAVSRAQIRAALPQAACFVVPNVSSLAQYRSARRSARTNWTLLRERTKMAIFLPNDASPQEARDCLHEELAQALGPLNDLYRLADSVFNDDNVHTVLTGFDMLILKAYYDPSLRNGMSRADVAARLPSILARINPAGEALPRRALRPTPRAWIEALQTALGPGAGPAERRIAAGRALGIAQQQGWRDHRAGFSHYAMGRLMQSLDTDQARRHFLAADRIYRAVPDTGLHRAYVASQLGAHALTNGDGRGALAIVSPHIATAAQYENAALMSSLMLLRAEALALIGDGTGADRLRLDSLGWARYGFGADWAVRAKLREIAALSPGRD